MKFNYYSFIEELKMDPDKKKIINEYELFVGDLGQNPLEQEIWYKQLVKPFKKLYNYKVPDELSPLFDWGLLSQLGASSISCDIHLSYENQDIHLKVEVENEGQHVIKDMDELMFFQVERLYAIWIEENLNLSTLCHSDDFEKKSIFKTKYEKMTNWNKKLIEVQNLIK